METLLNIKKLHANVGEKEILKGLDLTVNPGEVHVIMGPNGAGKSTLANVILNNPEYSKMSGEVIFENENINDLTTDKIAKKGIFMSFQLPEEIPGISVMNFLKFAKGKITEKPVKIFEFKKQVTALAEELIEKLRGIFAEKRPIKARERDQILAILTRLANAVNSQNEFILSQYNEAMENITAEAKGEIEAFVQNKINSLAMATLRENVLDVMNISTPLKLPGDDNKNAE